MCALKNWIQFQVNIISLKNYTTLYLRSVGKTAAATVLALNVGGVLLHVGHENTGTTGGALTSKTDNGTIITNLVVREDSKFNLLGLLLDLLGGGVDLLLSLLTTTAKSHGEVKNRLLLDGVVSKSTGVLELSTSEGKTLLVDGDTLFNLDLGLDGVNGGAGLNLERKSVAGEGLNKNLHFNEAYQRFVCSRECCNEFMLEYCCHRKIVMIIMVVCAKYIPSFLLLTSLRREKRRGERKRTFH